MCNFKRIEKVHFDTVAQIIKDKGRCINVTCSECPFHTKNAKNLEDCVTNGYAVGNKVLLTSCNTFLASHIHKRNVGRGEHETLLEELVNDIKFFPSYTFFIFVLVVGIAGIEIFRILFKQ